MNKQQLAVKIWESANQMRSKIEANEYKDYILGFIFYKYLSDQLVQFVSAQGMSADDIKALNESDAETVEFVQSNFGYFSRFAQRSCPKGEAHGCAECIPPANRHY